MLNPQLRDMVTTTPSMEDIVNNTNESKWFSWIDLEYAYHQVPLDDQSSRLTDRNISGQLVYTWINKTNSRRTFTEGKKCIK